jgi:hypothetical protein
MAKCDFKSLVYCYRTVKWKCFLPPVGAFSDDTGGKMCSRRKKNHTKRKSLNYELQIFKKNFTFFKEVLLFVKGHLLNEKLGIKTS